MILPRYAGCCVLYFLMAVAPSARAELPTDADVKRIRTKLDEARMALASSRAQLEPAEHDELSLKLAQAETALDRYVRLSEQGSARQAVTSPLYVAGGALIADDATGVGTVDDVLLPFIGLGLLITYAVTHAPARPSELESAWTNVVSKIQSLVQTAEVMSRRRKPGCHCRCFKRGIGPRGPWPSFE